MRVVAVLLSLCLSLNVMAAGVSELEKTLNDYQYEMTVNWDQKDEVFVEAQNAKLIAKLTELMNQGLTQADLLSMAEKKINNKVQFDALKTKLALMGEIKSPTELALAMKQISKDFYAQGASWNGEVFVYIGWAGAIALIAYMVWFSAKYECVEQDIYWDCRVQNYGTYSVTECGWYPYCVRYEEQ